MNQDAEKLFSTLWDGYVQRNPEAVRIAALLGERGDTICNDHIALRTFNRDPLRTEQILPVFSALGYRVAGSYAFPTKHLTAVHLEADEGMPKLFVSELEVAALSPSNQGLIDGLLAQVPDDFAANWPAAPAGRPWSLPYSTYQSLLAESEYAAWVAAFGICANHFTVDVGRLGSFASLQALNSFLLEEGFVLNEVGGVTKGTPADGLEQSSTVAPLVEVAFSDTTERLPGCYYEFALRHRMADGQLFSAFLAESAINIFASTDVGAKRRDA